MKHPTIPTLLAATALAVLPFASHASAKDKTENTIGLTDASIYEDKEVTDLQGNNIGHVEKLLVDSRDGRIRYAVVEVDKAWNWDDPEVAVPFGAFQIDRMGEDDVSLKLDTTKDKLTKAPKFKEGDAERLSDENESAPVYAFWTTTWYTDMVTPMTGDNATPTPTPSPSPTATPAE